MSDAATQQRALELLHLQNQQIDSLRECGMKPIWEGLPRQDLHSKLDKIEQNFLREMKMERDKSTYFQKEGQDYYQQVHQELQKSAALPAHLRNKIAALMRQYSSLKSSNESKSYYVDVTTNKAKTLRQKNDQLELQLEQKQAQLGKEKAIEEYRQSKFKKAANRMRLLFG